MGWFSLSPSQKKIDLMREGLEVVTSCPLPLNENFSCIFLAAGEFCLRTEISEFEAGKLFLRTELGKFDIDTLSFSAESEKIKFQFHLNLGGVAHEEIDFFQLERNTVRIETFPVFPQILPLIDLEDISKHWWKGDRDCFSVESRSVALVSETLLVMRKLDYSSFAVHFREHPLDIDCVCRPVDFTRFHVSIKPFFFSRYIPAQPSGLFSPPIPKTTVRVPRLLKAPEPPPDQTPSLEDRLRGILFPPIEELLSDPQLALPAHPHPYQVYGIKWLHDRNSALLADEMGLGKTMQAIIAARLLWREGAIKRILIVCPKSLISNWRKELGTWWPGIECFTRSIPPSNRKWFLLDATKDVVVKIINYEAVAKEFDWLKDKLPFHDLIIIDEAQRIKNPRSINSRAVKTLKSKRRWALTGTPVENSQNDLVSIFEFVKSDMIRESDSQAVIRQRTKPYMLRRKQEEVLKDLPEKIDHEIEVELGERQRSEYDRLETEGVCELNQEGGKITVTHVFSLISKLRKICNFDQASGESAKAKLISEELEEIIESGRKALIFGKLVEEPSGLKSLVKKISAFDPLAIHGGIPQNQRDNVIHEFEKNPKRAVLLLNYDVAGVGLNLQAANYVFLFDRWWNPAVEDQAVCRAYRMGQKLPVFVRRLYCKDTIEERIINKLKEKRRIFTNIVENIDENRPVEGLTDEEYFELFKGLKARPARPGAAASKAQLFIENMDPKVFENLVALVYENEGYAVRVTGKSHDGGIDIEAERTSGGGRDRVIIQCKRQKDNVGRQVVQQLWGVLNSNQTFTRCDLVTSSDFSAEAREFANGKRVTLVNGKEIKERAEKYGIAHFVTPPERNAVAPASTGAKQIPSAPGRPLDERRTLDAYYREFNIGWAKLLQKLGLPENTGITRDMTLAEARRIAKRQGGKTS